MAITRWEPFREIQTLRERINHMFEDAIVRPSSMWLADMVEGPAVDVYELDDKFVVEAQVPGFKLEEIEVGLTNRTLTIKAEHKLTEEVKEKTYYQREMRVGTLYRSLLLPDDIDTKSIQATLHNGVLEIQAKKLQELPTAKIDVKPVLKEKTAG